MKPTVLTFQLPAKHLAKLRMAAMHMGLAVRPVAVHEYLQPIGSFTGRCGSFESLYDGKGLPEPMLVFSGLPQGLLSPLLDAMRAAKIPPVSLKAVLTPSNEGWNTLELFQALCDERDALRRP